MFLFLAVNQLISVFPSEIMNFDRRKKACTDCFKLNYAFVLSMLLRETVVRVCAYSMCLCECAFYIKCWINHVKTDNGACHDCIIML